MNIIVTFDQNQRKINSLQKEVNDINGHITNTEKQITDINAKSK